MSFELPSLITSSFLSKFSTLYSTSAGSAAIDKSLETLSLDAPHPILALIIYWINMLGDKAKSTLSW